MTGAPLPFQWHGDAMIPLAGFQRRADEAFTIGQVYRLTEVEERSEVSHRQEFAWLRDAWASLPEALTAKYPTPEHLRKQALIMTGWCNVTDYVCTSTAEAIRWASNLRKELDEYAVVIVERGVVRVLKAKSQARTAMGKADFQASKTSVLEWVAKLLDVTPATLERQKESA